MHLPGVQRSIPMLSTRQSGSNWRRPEPLGNSQR